MTFECWLKLIIHFYILFTYKAYHHIMQLSWFFPPQRFKLFAFYWFFKSHLKMFFSSLFPTVCIYSVLDREQSWSKIVTIKICNAFHTSGFNGLPKSSSERTLEAANKGSKYIYTELQRAGLRWYWCMPCMHLFNIAKILGLVEV